MKSFLSDPKIILLGLTIGLLAACVSPKVESVSEKSSSSDILENDRMFSFTYSVQVYPTMEALDIFLPIAQSSAQQTILSMDITSLIDGEIGQEQRYGNKFWHAELPDGLSDTLDIAIVYRAKRPVNSMAYREKMAKNKLTENALNLFLSANARVPVDGALIDSIRTKLAPAPEKSLAKARSIYDYVVGNMEYKKVGTGWGNGDTYWACSEQYGNCTDFHALFTSLARAEGIPSRFEIGFPVPDDKESGTIGGYHCWVNFYLDETGWFPVDASEAQKDLSKQDLLFGTQPSDRMQFTTGRDLELGAGHESGPLNYFIYPHIEQSGKLYMGFSRNFSYINI